MYAVISSRFGEFLTIMSVMQPGEQKMMDYGLLSSYPYVPGADLSGTVTTVGADVKAFQPGDRVISLQISTESSVTNRGAALQDYAIVDADLAAKVPDFISAVEAATVPVTVITN